MNAASAARCPAGWRLANRLPPLPRTTHSQTALAADPADRAPGQEEPGSEDEVDDAELRKVSAGAACAWCLERLRQQGRLMTLAV